MPIDLQNLLTAIQHRRSFKVPMLRPDPVDRALIEQVLEAARWAPTHGRTEPWHFTVFTGNSRHALANAMAEAYKLDAQSKNTFTQPAMDSTRDKVLAAPVWIAIAMKPGTRPDGKGTMPEEEELIAVGCSVLLMHLVASALNLGAQWTSGITATHPHVAQFLNLTPPARLLGFFYLGHPAIPWPTSTRKPLSEKVQWME